MQDNKEMTISDFEKKYTLVKNHFTESSAFDDCLFETFGEEKEYVLNRSKDLSEYKHVWTVIDADGWYGIIANYHIVNRLGFLITTEPWENEEEQYTISDEGPVNDWFFSLDLEEKKELFPEIKLNKLLSIEDQIDGYWFDHDVDEREKIMQKFKK